MRIWLFDELESLRDLNERQELEKAKRALKGSPRQKELLLKEVELPCWKPLQRAAY